MEELKEAYTDYVDVVMSEALRLACAVDTQTPLRLRYALEGRRAGLEFRVCVRADACSSPGCL